MNAENRLMAIGWPLEDALTVCHSMKKERELERFVSEQEEEYRRKCAEYVKEMVD